MVTTSIQERYPFVSTTTKHEENKKYYYTDMKNVHLNGDKNSPMVNFFSVQVIEIKNGIVADNCWHNSILLDIEGESTFNVPNGKQAVQLDGQLII